MTLYLSRPVLTLMRSAVALAIAAVGSLAMAADPPSLTVDPTAVGLIGTAVMANNILIANYARMMFAAVSSQRRSGPKGLRFRDRAGPSRVPEGGAAGGGGLARARSGAACR